MRRGGKKDKVKKLKKQTKIFFYFYSLENIVFVFVNNINYCYHKSHNRNVKNNNNIINNDIINNNDNN